MSKSKNKGPKWYPVCKDCQEKSEEPISIEWSFADLDLKCHYCGGVTHDHCKVGEFVVVTHRLRRGKLVEIPEQWRGKIVHRQTMHKRASKHPDKEKGRYKKHGKGYGETDKTPSPAERIYLEEDPNDEL